MQLHRKTRQGLFSNLIKLFIKILIPIAILTIIIFFVNQLDFPKPSQIIKQEIPNEKFEVVK